MPEVLVVNMEDCGNWKAILLERTIKYVAIGQFDGIFFRYFSFLIKRSLENSL
ncbi:MAG: hypothetical protein LKE40_08310 [Spirochaetia bacterium]|jgi:hypothetical protein|nr:hypothetical protein [Spirochaetia bacterium]